MTTLKEAEIYYESLNESNKREFDSLLTAILDNTHGQVASNIGGDVRRDHDDTKSISCLRDGIWLNDEVVNFWSAECCRQCNGQYASNIAENKGPLFLSFGF